MASTLGDARPHRLAPAPRRRRRLRALAGLELVTGVIAVVGGLLLTIDPDGSLLKADPTVLAGSPFGNYRWPGVLLVALVGGGFLLTGVWQWRSGRGARALSVVAGIGLIAFEISELLWLGFQPLEGVFATVGAIVVASALLAGRGEGPVR